MTGEEKRIWRAAYAASFATLAIAENQDAPSCVRAVRAIRIADSAVASLRDRRKTGDPRAGKHIW